nr:VOC family protein [bacterium]
MIQSIAHVALEVPDMDKAFDFYCGIMGFTHKRTLYNADGSPSIQFLEIAPGQMMELFYAEAPKVADASWYRHVCLFVSNVQEEVARIRALGAPIDVEPCIGKSGFWLAYTRDPFGNAIELMDPVPAAEQA